MSAPSIQDASWLSYSCCTYGGQGVGGQGVAGGECGVKEEVRDERSRERGRESDLVHSGHQLGHHFF